MDPMVGLDLLWAHRALVETSLGCRMTIQRLCVLLLALGRPRIDSSDIQVLVDEFEGTVHGEWLRPLGRARRAYGQMYQLHKLGLMTGCDEPGFYTLSAHVRLVLERVLALERRSEGEPVALDRLLGTRRRVSRDVIRLRIAHSSVRTLSRSRIWAVSSSARRMASRASVHGSGSSIRRSHSAIICMR